MKRSPIVLAGTALGLAGVLSYHLAAPSSSGLATGAAVARTTTTTATATATATAGSSHTATSAPTRHTSSRGSAAIRSATGEEVTDRYGDIQLKVTERGGRITDISVVRIDETDPRSVQIDQIAVPQLQQQALAAQSARIDGISGASFTSQAYAQSLQSALDKLA